MTTYTGEAPQVAEREVYDLDGLMVDGVTGEILDAAPGSDALAIVTARGLEAMEQMKVWEQYLALLKQTAGHLLGPERAVETTRAGVARRVIQLRRNAPRERLPQVAEKYELSHWHLAAIFECARTFDPKLIDELVKAGNLPADAADELIEPSTISYMQFSPLRKVAPRPQLIEVPA